MWQAVLSFLVSSVSRWVGPRRNRWRLQLWEDAVTACDLRVTVRSSAWAWRMELKAGDQPLKIRFEATGRRGKGTRVVIPGPPGFSGVSIRREQSQSLWKREIEVGDQAFDRTFFLEGPTWLVCALLDSEVRRLLIRMNDESPVEIVGGTLQAEMRDEQVPELLPLLLDLGRRFAQPLNAAQRLAENAHRDPATRVRLQNLLLLIREFPGEQGTVEALRTACTDPSPEIRLRVAQELGAEGHDALVKMAESAVGDIWSAQAVSILGQALPTESARAILTESLAKRRFLTARVCVDVLSQSGDAAAVGALAKAMECEQGELAAAAAQALGWTGSTAAEAQLIFALEQVDTDVLFAAAIALGRVGTAAAILPLKALTNRHPPHSDVGRATRQAIAAIQNRLPGASPGQLSIAEIQAEAGRLSLAQGEGGELSLAADPAGRLSLTEHPAARQD